MDDGSGGINPLSSACIDLVQTAKKAKKAQVGALRLGNTPFSAQAVPNNATGLVAIYAYPIPQPEPVAKPPTTLLANNPGLLFAAAEVQWVTANPRFFELWHIENTQPNSVWNRHFERQIEQQLQDPETFTGRMRALYQDRERISQFDIPRKGTQTLRCISTPLTNAHHEYLGRIWFYLETPLYSSDEVPKLD